MRIVIDYRPALRARTGVGEYIHQVTRALARRGEDAISIFSSSWKDRLSPSTTAELGPTVHAIDQRIPVSVLNLAWHRLEWPAIESLAGEDYDIAHSPHPLLLPARSAAQVVTIHDVHFMDHPERTSAEVKRDYPALAAEHAQRAHRVIVSSRFAKGEVERALGVSPERIVVCPAGGPGWSAPSEPSSGGPILFMGTLEPRKNVGGLLEAYSRLIGTVQLPRLTLAGTAGPGAEADLARISAPPLAGRVDHLGYVRGEDRERLFKSASLFVLPSFEEGFGLTALEAMASGVPVIVSSRGALPELVGDAGLLVDPGDPDSIAEAIRKMVVDPAFRERCIRRGFERAATYTWESTAREVRRAYCEALEARKEDGSLVHAHRH